MTVNKEVEYSFPWLGSRCAKCHVCSYCWDDSTPAWSWQGTLLKTLQQHRMKTRTNNVPKVLIKFSRQPVNSRWTPKCHLCHSCTKLIQGESSGALSLSCSFGSPSGCSAALRTSHCSRHIFTLSCNKAPNSKLLHCNNSVLLNCSDLLMCFLHLIFPVLMCLSFPLS